MLGALLGYVLGHHPDASAQTAVAARPETVAVEETYIAAYLEDFQDVPQRSLSDLYLNSRILPEEEKP
jgi:hypothetical protein